MEQSNFSFHETIEWINRLKKSNNFLTFFQFLNQSKKLKTLNLSNFLRIYFLEIFEIVKDYTRFLSLSFLHIHTPCTLTPRTYTYTHTHTHTLKDEKQVIMPVRQVCRQIPRPFAHSYSLSLFRLFPKLKKNSYNFKKLTLSSYSRKPFLEIIEFTS